MQLNVSRAYVAHTHGGAPAFAHLTPIQSLRRSVLSCLLWEREFYEDGASIADRIIAAAKQVSTDDLAQLAIEARSVHNLRHVPLLLLCALAERGGRKTGDTIYATIQRADELSEFLSLYWRTGKRPLSKQVKLGLARAFRTFSAHELAKYDRAKAIRLRDVLFLCHAKPVDDIQAAEWKALIDGTLAAPDTWEVALSAGADKKATWERLLTEGKLGYLAVLRNLRNMTAAGVDPSLMRTAILARRGAHRVLPFRFIAAARACPQMEPALDAALAAGLQSVAPLAGRTAVLVDVSDSMNAPLSAKSDLKRMDAAAALASIIRAEQLRVFTFSEQLVEVAPRRGMAGVDAVVKSQRHWSTRLAEAMTLLNANVEYDRLIVITDEQVTDGRLPDPKGIHNYMVNVASARNGVGYGKWTHLDGFSEGILRWIAEAEKV